MGSLRIAFEYPFLVEEGAGVYAFGLVDLLTKLNHEVHVICPETSNAISNPLDDVLDHWNRREAVFNTYLPEERDDASIVEQQGVSDVGS